ncbi:MAG: TolC family protein [Verrucomicrobiae bacterium]|nr:TolC family protein [Verrucomicrobiae bacterium]
MIKAKRITLGTVLLSLSTATVLLVLGVSQGEDAPLIQTGPTGSAETSAAQASGPFVPPSHLADTLSGEQAQSDGSALSRLRRKVLGVQNQSIVPDTLLATTDGQPLELISTGETGGNGIVETFPLAEVRIGDQDGRFDLPFSNPPRAKADSGSGELRSALAAVSTGSATDVSSGDHQPQARSTEDLIHRIEKLRTGFREEVSSADDTGEKASGIPEAASSVLSNDSPPKKKIAEEQADRPKPYAMARPASSRPTIGQQISTRTLANENAGGEGVFASSSPIEEEIASVGPDTETPFSNVAAAAPPINSPERKGLLGRLFSKKPTREERAAAAAAAASKSSLETFPHPDAPKTKASKAEDQSQEMIDEIYQEYVERVARITASDLSPDALNGAKGLPSVPADFKTVWMDSVRKGYWVGEEPLAVRLEEVYARALINSNRVRAYGYEPLIRESAIQESEGAFDLESFVNGTYGHSDDPTSSILDTGEIGRFLENRGEGEAGLRRRFATGGQLTLSNRFLTLKNNSEFVEPNPQTSSTVVLSVAQPLLKGAGYHYNKARLKVAKIDSGVAASEYIQQLENHLLEVNQAYWGVYFARAAYLLRKSLVAQTEEIVNTLEARSDEATASELLRSRSELSRRRTSLNRSELAIRNAEERLRSLVNDPEFPIGGDGEFVPITTPLLTPPQETVQATAMEAVDNRAEIAASFGELRVAAIRNEAGKHERLPQLDLIAESRLAGLDANRRVGGAYDDMLSQEASWLVGFQYSQPWENNFAKSRHERLQYELLRQADVVRSTMDTILLESVVTYREMMTVYRDLQGNLQQVLSTREEVRGLKERLDVDADNGQTVAYRLQNVMDALERNQLAEEQFLVSVVTYNIAFASLEQAKGTFLKYQDVGIERSQSQEHKRLETLRAVPSVPVSSSASAAGAK